MRDSLCSRKAFTLVEVVVVMSIISIVTVITLVSFSAQRNTRGIDRALREVVAALREAQNYALAGRSAAGEDNCWIGIDMPGSGSSYTIMNNFRTGSTCAASSNATIGSYSLKGGVTFSSTERIGFTLPRGDVLYLSGGVMNTLATGSRPISVVKDGVTQYVCVYATGRIVANGTSSTCP